MVKGWILYLFLIFVLIRCVSPLETDLSEPQDILIVEGFIDDDFGPHEIEISLLSLFAGVTEGGARRRPNADVSITDNLGNTVILNRTEFIRVEVQKAPGDGCGPFLSEQPAITNFLTPPDFRGIPGRSYSIQIELEDGRLFRSKPEILLASPEIDSVFVEFATRPSDNTNFPNTGLDVFVSWKDESGTQNFHFWEVNGTFRIETPPIAGLCCVYDPRDNGSEDCWVIESNLNEPFTLFEDRLADGESKVERIAFIRDDGLRFSSSKVSPERQYYVEVEQYTMTQSAFEFARTMESLSEIDGEIFDPSPVGAIGNIVNVNNPDELVVGYFGAYGKIVSGTFVRRDQLDEIVPRSICGDCRSIVNGQLETPEVYR